MLLFVWEKSETEKKTARISSLLEGKYCQYGITQVWRCNHPHVIDELFGGFRFRRFLRIDVDGRPTAVATLECVKQGGLVHDATTCHVHHADTLPALGQRGR